MHAPTGAARWYNQLTEDFKVTQDSPVQVVDVGSLDDEGLYSWWIDNTAPKHPVLADRDHQLLQQIEATGQSLSEAIVIGCDGSVKFHQAHSLSEETYAQVKSAVEQALKDPSCVHTFQQE